MASPSRLALALLFALAGYTAQVQAQTDLSAEQADVCRLVGAQGLECFVWLDVNATMADYEQDLATEAPTSDLAFAPFFLMPRYQAATGQPGFAFAAITDWLEATAGNEYELWGNPTGGLYLTASQLASDPLPADNETEPPDALAIEDFDIRGDAMIVAARLLARNGETARANAVFGHAIGRSDQVERLFAMWAAAGFAVNATEAAGDLDPADGARARIAVVEGLALTGNANATLSAARDLPDALAVRGEMATAEAWRRQGQTGQARAALDRIADDLAAGSGDATPETIRRLAQGYALLGDTARARTLMLADLGTRQLREGLAWTDIAPMIACYDLDMALELAGGDPMAVADVLVAAAASGAGQAAYTFAANQAQDFDRTLYLIATVIGLRHAKLAADPSLPCATVTVIGD